MVLTIRFSTQIVITSGYASPGYYGGYYPYSSGSGLVLGTGGYGFNSSPLYGGGYGGGYGGYSNYGYQPYYGGSGYGSRSYYGGNRSYGGNRNYGGGRRHR